MVDTEQMFEESARLIADVASHPEPVASGMSRWFDFCESVAPAQSKLWSQLRKLDFDADQDGGIRRLSVGGISWQNVGGRNWLILGWSHWLIGGRLTSDAREREAVRVMAVNSSASLRSRSDR